MTQLTGGDSVGPWCLIVSCGSACGPVIVPVFKTGGWQAILSPMGSTPIRFRHLFSLVYVDLDSVLE